MARGGRDAGHRRWRAACPLALDAVPVIVRAIDNPLEAERVLIESNRQREKTPSEMMREAENLTRIFAEEARRRMLAGITEDGAGGRGKQKNPVATLPQGLGGDHKTRTQVAESVGKKPRTYAKIKQVYDTANDEAAPEPIRAVAQQQMAALDTGETTAHAAEKAGLPLTFRQFIEAPYPVGVGSTLEQIKKIVALHSRRELLPDVAESLATMRETIANLLNPSGNPHGGDRRSPGFQDNNIILNPPPEQQGTSRDYTLARLKRDRPDLAELVLGGACLTSPIYRTRTVKNGIIVRSMNGRGGGLDRRHGAPWQE